MDTIMKIKVLIIVALLLIPAVTVNAQEGWGHGCISRADWTGTYTVQRGENLFRIARRYGLSTLDLAAGNCIMNPNRIFAGQTLRVPGGSPGFPGYQTSITDSFVNFRTGPGREYPAMRTLSYEAVTALGRSQDTNWLYVRTAAGQEGWVWSYYVGLSGDLINTLPVVSGPVHPPPPQLITARVMDWQAALRYGPGEGFGIARWLIQWEGVYVLGRSADTNWVRVRTNDGIEGWVWSYSMELHSSFIITLPVLIY